MGRVLAVAAVGALVAVAIWSRGDECSTINPGAAVQAAQNGDPSALQSLFALAEEEMGCR